MIKRKGSLTIEASWIMPIVLIVIIMMIYLLFFYYNKITVWKNTYYTGIKIIEKERDGIPYDLKKEWNELSKNTLVLPENIKVSEKKSVTTITVIGEIQFTIPFFGKISIQEKSVLPLCSGKEAAVRSIVWR